VLPTAVALQSVSEWVQNWFKFLLIIHKLALLRPEEAEPWLEQFKITDHKEVSFCKCSLAFAFAGLALP
jgi:hypothetical protein